jgi:hypothetical protein
MFHVLFLGLGVCMLDVYYTERWYSIYPAQGCSQLRRAYIPRLLGDPGSCLVCPFFSFCLAHEDSFTLARWRFHSPEARCLRPPSASILELLAPCSGASDLLTSKRGALDVTAGMCLTTGLSLHLAETSTAGSLVVPVPCDGAPEVPAPS